MLQAKVLFVAILFGLAITTNAFACGAGELTDEQVSTSAELEAVKTQIQTLYGQEVAIESIVRSGNKILDLDKNEVASAMCAANYINVYMQPGTGSGLLCMVTFSVYLSGVIKVEDGEFRAECRTAAGSAANLVTVPFQRSF